MAEKKRFHRYRMVRKIARGGMAEIYLATDELGDDSEQKIALKKILPLYAGLEEFTRRFRDEQRIAARLEHSSIVKIHDAGVEDGEQFIAMEYVDGPDLEQVIERCLRRASVIPVEVICHMGARLAAALDYAHTLRDERGEPMKIVHRDVSPPNILLEVRGGVKLTDFGVAKASVREAKTAAGVTHGKFHYMSPEQVNSRPVDHRSDLFSLGAVLYQALTGERPFEGETEKETREKVRAAKVRSPSELRPDCGPELQHILLRLLEVEPDARHQSAGELRGAFEAIAPPRKEGALALRQLLRELFPDESDGVTSRLPEGQEPPWEHLCHRMPLSAAPAPELRPLSWAPGPPAVASLRTLPEPQEPTPAPRPRLPSPSQTEQLPVPESTTSEATSPTAPRLSLAQRAAWLLAAVAVPALILALGRWLESL